MGMHLLSDVVTRGRRRFLHTTRVRQHGRKECRLVTLGYFLAGRGVRSEGMVPPLFLQIENLWEP